MTRLGETVTRLGETVTRLGETMTRLRLDPQRWDLESPRLLKLTRRAAVILVVIGICGFLIDGASRAERPSLMPTNGRVTEAGLKDFGAAFLTVVPGHGKKPAAPRCVLTARTAKQQAQGLRGQHSLYRFAGLLVVYSKPTTAPFDGRGNDLALSVAWFDRSGRYIAAADTRLCQTHQRCLTYSAGHPYLYALEVPVGKLRSMGVGPGAQLQLGGPCSG